MGVRLLEEIRDWREGMTMTPQQPASRKDSCSRIRRPGLIPSTLVEDGGLSEETAMPFGDTPAPGWHTWIAWAAIIALGLLGMFLFLAMAL
jgi:hypothetical protein